MFLVIAYFWAIIICVLLICRPISYYWAQFQNPEMEGHCFNDAQYYLGIGVANMVIDIFVLVYPIPIIWKLQLDARKKVGVVGILMLGSL